MRTKYSIIALAAAALLSIPFTFAIGEPENVTGLTANAVNETSIGLTWNSAHDANDGLVNHYRIYYGATSIQTAGQGNYENELNTPNNNTSYVVGSLTAGTTYYFSATAIDGNGVESEAYSLEASAATPGLYVSEQNLVDTTAPIVTRAIASYKTQVIVEFSEPVVLPSVTPQSAFSIMEQVISANALGVTNAQTDMQNAAKVILTTAEQKSNVSYIVTAGVAVADLSGNTIVSGNTDSGLFMGSALTTPAQEQAAPELEEAPAPAIETNDCGNDETCFYASFKTCVPVKITTVSGQTQTKREVTGAENGQCVLKYEVAGMLDLANPKTLECRLPVNGLSIRADRVTGDNGGLFENEDEAKAMCIGSYLNDFLRAEFAAAPARDITPPENVTGLTLSFREEIEKFIVMLKWIASLNSAGDLVDQILYMSMDRGKNYGQGQPLGPTKTDHEVQNLEGGKEYTFKLTTKDTSGNESTGVVKSIRLPQTGAAVGLLILGSLLATKRILKRR